MDTSKELKTVGKIGIWVTLITNVYFLIETIRIFVIFMVNREHVLGFSFLGYDLPMDFYGFLFVMVPVLVGLSLFFQVKLLLKDFNFQSRAFFFGLLSGSVVGSILLWVGRVPLPKAEVPEDIQTHFTRDKYKLKFVPSEMPSNELRFSNDELLTKYAKLLHLGIITEEEFEKMKQKFSPEEWTQVSEE